MSAIQIYTVDSKIDSKTFAFCVVKESIVQHTNKIRINNENSVYQAVLLALQDSINGEKSTTYNSFTIYTDSLSSLIALKNINSKNKIISEIIQQLQHNQKIIYFEWVKSHAGVTGKELADKFRERSNIKFNQFPYPHLKILMKKEILTKCQREWDNAETGRYAYQLFPKIKDDVILHNRNLYLFPTNHGAFYILLA